VYVCSNVCFLQVVELATPNPTTCSVSNPDSRFYAPWCGHCQNLKPAYDKLAESLQGIVKVAAIDCDDEKNKRTCGEHGIQGFPTLKIFKPSKQKGKPVVEGTTNPTVAPLNLAHNNRL